MSRSGYSEDCEYINLYRQTVKCSIKGNRGQAFLRELAAAMDEMRFKQLITDQLVSNSGDCCAIGAVCIARGLDVNQVDYNDPEEVADVIGISPSMTAEIAFMNDEWTYDETPKDRWKRIRNWVNEQLIQKINL